MGTNGLAASMGDVCILYPQTMSSLSELFLIESPVSLTKLVLKETCIIYSKLTSLSFVIRR